jgi:hypothetical protein
MESLRFPIPTTPASEELNRLLDQRRDLAGRLSDAEVSSRFASAEQMQASRALQDAERRRATGQDVTADEVRKLEKAVAASKAKAAEPWNERVAGLRAAQRDHDNAIHGFATDHWDDLAGELADEANAAATRIDEALRELDRAYIAREDVARRQDALIAGVIGRSKQGLVATSKVEALVRDGAAILMDGGERAPVMTRDPRVPLAGQVTQDVEAWT